MSKLVAGRWGYIAAAVLVLIVGGMLGAAYFNSQAPLRHDLALCDDAIKATLKAPSTYRRVAAPDVYYSERRNYRVEYDADNAFGVPMRGKGFCTLDGNRTSATWVDMP